MAIVYKAIGLQRARRMLLAGALALILVLGVACQGGDPTTAPTEGPQSASQINPTATLEDASVPEPTAISPTPSPVTRMVAAPTETPTGFPVVVTDSNGNDVTFDVPPERIVALTSVVVEILFALGEGHRIVATHDFVAYPPEADSVPRVGSAFSVNVEQVIAADPDLISVFYASSYEAVENLGPQVLYLESPSTLDGIPDRMRLWGRITGKREAGESLAVDFETKLDAILADLASLEQGPRLFHDDSLLYTRGPGTILGQVYDLLKVQNIAHDIDGYGQLTPEILVERDPEVIVTTFPTRIQEFMEDPAFQDVSAVRNGRVYVVEPDGLVSVFGTRFIDGIEVLAKLIYPDRFE